MRLFTVMPRMALLQMLCGTARLALALAWPIVITAQAAGMPPGITIHVEQQGNAVAVAARALLTAPLPLIWETLTDYAHFPRFIPGMLSSRVIERRAEVSRAVPCDNVKNNE